MMMQLDKKNNGANHPDEIKNQVAIFVVLRPLHAFLRLMRKRRQEPVKIIAADAGKKYKEKEIVRIRKMEHIARLPGHED